MRGFTIAAGAVAAMTVAASLAATPAANASDFGVALNGTFHYRGNGDFALVNDDDEVRIHDCGKAMGDHERCPAGAKLFKSVLDLLLGRGVDCACGLVKYDDLWLTEDATSDGYTLKLSAG